jgi:hypothetical protein
MREYCKHWYTSCRCRRLAGVGAKLFVVLSLLLFMMASYAQFQLGTARVTSVVPVNDRGPFLTPLVSARTLRPAVLSTGMFDRIIPTACASKASRSATATPFRCTSSTRFAALTTQKTATRLSASRQLVSVKASMSSR